MTKEDWEGECQVLRPFPRGLYFGYFGSNPTERGTYGGVPKRLRREGCYRVTCVCMVRFQHTMSERATPHFLTGLQRHEKGGHW